MPDLTLDLRYLKYAVQVAEAGSFRRAAERLSISQSTVSRRVQLFERQLGFSLFKRTRADLPPFEWTPMLAFRSWRGVSDECST
ncbi:LysR family transcriptional regulator, partial [uncultured Brevundimonas sp.]|uniref:helix-turn-helix domain-containing protein n=1 Tax=uncultured Brevundimonas sp. TaxID=213418 RepID=UPI002621356B